jgi:hypothetical protein
VDQGQHPASLKSSLLKLLFQANQGLTDKWHATLQVDYFLLRPLTTNKRRFADSITEGTLFQIHLYFVAAHLTAD